MAVPTEQHVLQHGTQALVEDRHPHLRPSAALVEDMITTEHDDVVSVRLSSLPGLKLTFEQRRGWNHADVGGVLWSADRVMAKYLLLGAKSLWGPASVASDLLLDEIAGVTAADPVMEPARPAFASDERGIALVLGCGGVPLSGFAAHTKGWDVVLTDLQEVLQQTRRNVESNLHALQEVCIAERCLGWTDQADRPQIYIHDHPFGDIPSLASSIEAVAGEQRGKCTSRPLLIMCSDCIWLRSLHLPLLESISSALCHAEPGRAFALVAFESRDAVAEKSFLASARSDDFGLSVTEIDIDELCSLVDMPTKLRRTMGVGTSSAIHMYRLAAKPSPGRAMAERRMRWNLRGLSPAL